MTGCLLDTSVALLATSRPELLSLDVRTGIESCPVFLSAVSFWEVTIKAMKGKLAIGDPRSWWRMALDDLAATPIGLAPEHVAEIYNLPPIHADPFDRALLAQAVSTSLSFATTDRDLMRYASDRLTLLT